MESVEFWAAAFNTWHCTLITITIFACGVYVLASSNVISAVAAAVVVLTDIGLAVVNLGYGATNNETFFFVFGFVWISLAIMYSFNFVRCARRALNEQGTDSPSCSPGNR